MTRPTDTSTSVDKVVYAVQREVERFVIECPACGEWHEREETYRAGEQVRCECKRLIEVMR